MTWRHVRLQFPPSITYLPASNHLSRFLAIPLSTCALGNRVCNCACVCRRHAVRAAAAAGWLRARCHRLRPGGSNRLWPRPVTAPGSQAAQLGPDGSCPDALRCSHASVPQFFACWQRCALLRLLGLGRGASHGSVLSVAKKKMTGRAAGRWRRQSHVLAWQRSVRCASCGRHSMNEALAATAHRAITYSRVGPCVLASM